MHRALLVAVLLATPGAVAQALPSGNNNSAPSPSTGNDGHAAGPAESNETAPGIIYGLLVLLGTLAFVGVLAYVGIRYNHDRK